MNDKVHTASKNVRIIDPAFLIPQLNRTRRIWIYLPYNYSGSRKRFPVLYMQDGQNLFDEYTSFSGEWRVDEALDAMHAETIVVGIDNGGDRRMNEYNPNDNEQFGKGEGREYLQFIVKTLKPFIDKKYRTLRTRKNTFVAGSSMGGLISFYAALYYPAIFGGAGVFSPAFWLTPQIGDEIKKMVSKKSHSRQKYFFYAGNLESSTMVSEMLGNVEVLRQKANPTIRTVILPDGEHNEASWSREFPVFYEWMMEV